MIIENNNNENQNINNINNINNNNFIINYNKFRYFIKKLLFFFFMFIMLLFTSYQIYFYYKELLYIKSEKLDNIKEEIINPITNILYFKRQLNLFNISNKKIGKESSQNNTTIVPISNKSLNKNEIEEILKQYSFILDLSSNDYIGNWSSFSMINNSFFNNKIRGGTAEIFFKKIKNRNNLVINLNKDKANSFKIDAILREGKYIDKYVRINFTFSIFANIEKLLKNNKIILHNNLTKMEYSKMHFLRDNKKEKIDKGNITLILEKEEYSHISNYRKRIISQYYKAHLIITSKELNVTINTKVSNNEELGQKVRIYSLILSIFGLIEIYHILKLIMKINEHNEIGNKLSILSISTNCYFKVMICIMHFFLSISTSDEDISYQFGVPTIIYFFGFTGFELKLLLIVFKTRNNQIANQDMYRRRLLCLYLFFYISLSIMIINIKECLTNFSLIFVVYSFSWLGQIIHSIIINARPPMSRMYIIMLSLGRLYLPIYIKGYKGNIFDLKPSYLKVSLLIIITFIEVIILLLQKSFGARTILPKRYRRRGFDYYKDKVNIENHISKNPNCVICLENLTFDVDENFNIKKQKNKKHRILHICRIDSIIDKIHRWLNNMEGKNTKKKYMITPCDHVFHTICLEKWMKLKNECPYCKGVLPPIE